VNRALCSSGAEQSFFGTQAGRATGDLLACNSALSAKECGANNRSSVNTGIPILTLGAEYALLLPSKGKQADKLISAWCGTVIAAQSRRYQMKFMIFVKANPDIEARIEKTSESEMREQMAEMERFNYELRKAGVLKDCDGLRPSAEGKRVRFDGNARTVVDGPFAGDFVAGYWLWELPSIEAAVGWVKRCPNPMPVPSEIEIRPI
jgi:hypothetical protein